jgi:HJR/Mrr/RecB family endonuclease
MKHKKVYTVSGNNQLVIDLPESFKNKDKVLVIIDDVIETKEEKLEILKEAMSDPLFLSDMQEVNKDFDAIDDETL